MDGQELNKQLLVEIRTSEAPVEQNVSLQHHPESAWFPFLVEKRIDDALPSPPVFVLEIALAPFCTSFLQSKGSLEVTKPVQQITEPPPPPKPDPEPLRGLRTRQPALTRVSVAAGVRSLQRWRSKGAGEWVPLRCD